jgi:hypothetical protein
MTACLFWLLLEHHQHQQQQQQQQQQQLPGPPLAADVSAVKGSYS